MDYSEEIYPTNFFFYFKNKDSAKKCALFLEGKGLKIIEISESGEDSWLLLAYIDLIDDESGFEYFDDFQLYAEMFDGFYDGHETEIKL